MIYNEIKKKFILQYIKEDKKMKKKNENFIKDGAPWTVIGHFPTYNEAVKKVDEEREPNSDYDYKIKKCENDFRVKRRLRKELVENKNKKKNKP
tara:strand:- start:47 stop:328 length:282 start_codon:yes stop_codon:yes gene_type:complete